MSKVLGIIAEYNPFHNGHLYHLQKSKEETGETLGWFDCFTVGETAEKSYLVISMVENASQNGGSHYLIPKIRKLL